MTFRWGRIAIDRIVPRAASVRRVVSTVAAMTCAVVVSITANAGTPASAADATAVLVPVGPIRLADTRQARCGCTPSDPGPDGEVVIDVDVSGHDGVPDGAVAAALTITATRTSAPGFVSVFPAGSGVPDTSTVNTRSDRVVANSTIVPLGDGSISVLRSGPGEVIVDLTAVFVPASRSTAGRLVPDRGRRLLDTRTGPIPSPGERLALPLPTGVAADATALVVNITNVRAPIAGYLSARPSASPPTETSVLNPNGSGGPVAAATIVPVDSGGMVIDAVSGGHVIVDLLGWFTGPSAPDSDDGLFVPAAPRRTLDTRTRPGRVYDGGTVEVASPFPAAAAVATNVTVVRPDRRGYLTAYAAGLGVPATSTTNPDSWNHTVANFAITAVSDRGTAYRSSGGSDLIVDVTGWFTGDPETAVMPPPANTARRSRVLIIGDSTLAALAFYPETRTPLTGFDYELDAGNCRRLLRPSCLSPTTGRIPTTAVEAIDTAPGSFDIVVVKAGYNDWNSDFPGEFDAVVRASRRKGAHTIVWMSYNEDVTSTGGRRAYQENNADLRVLVTRPEYSDVLMADWLRYSGQRRDWFWDGIHTTISGSWALADYIARWVAAVEHRSCERPWSIGAARPDPCPPPELIGPVTNPRSLY